MRLTALAVALAPLTPLTTNNVARNLCAAVDNIARDVEVILNPVAHLAIRARGDERLLNCPRDILPDVAAAALSTSLTTTLADAAQTSAAHLSMAERMN